MIAAMSATAKDAAIVKPAPNTILLPGFAELMLPF